MGHASCLNFAGMDTGGYKTSVVGRSYLCSNVDASTEIIVTKCYMQNLSEYADSANFKISVFIESLVTYRGSCTPDTEATRIADLIHSYIWRFVVTYDNEFTYEFLNIGHSLNNFSVARNRVFIILFLIDSSYFFA
jgi:hypothetical protein